MKLIMVDVISKDGFITKGRQLPSEWASKEDQQSFEQIKSRYNLFIMGSKLYDEMKDTIKPRDGLLRVILTSHPERYEAYKSESLVFSSAHPKELMNQYKDYTEGLLLGGGQINGAFWKEGLIDEAFITIEPEIFGEGVKLFGESEVDLSEYTIIETKDLNTTGTVLVQYDFRQTVQDR